MGISNSTLSCIDISSNTIGKRGACYRANKPNNLVIISKSYIEKAKMLMHNNKAIKESKHPEKG